MSVENRIQPRVSSALSVRLKHARRDGSRTRTIQNISLGGIACFSDEAVPTGDLVSVDLSIGGQLLQLEGRVVWCRRAPGGHFELGLRFEEGAAESRERVYRDLAEIERYRHEVLMLEGRQLSSDAAALEWMKNRGIAAPGGE